MTIDANNVGALGNKGSTLSNLGKNEEAITWYDKALEIDPKDVNPLRNQAVAVET